MKISGNIFFNLVCISCTELNVLIYIKYQVYNFVIRFTVIFFKYNKIYEKKKSLNKNEKMSKQYQNSSSSTQSPPSSTQIQNDKIMNTITQIYKLQKQLKKNVGDDQSKKKHCKN